MSDDDREYYCRRAEEEITRAQSAEDARLVSFHYHLAGLYLDKVYGDADVTPGEKAP